MSLHESFWTVPAVQAVGWALIHFMWQGFLIGGLTWLMVTSLRFRSAESRYAACSVGMILMLVAPVATMLLHVRGVSNPWDYAADRLLPLIGTSGGGSDWLGSLLPWLTGFWLLGAFTLHVRLIVKFICAERIKRSGLAAASEHLRMDLASLRDRLGITRVVRIMESSLVAVPSVIGWLSPIVLIPAGISTRLTPMQIRAIIAHELAHIRRNDYIVNLVQNVFESLLFFHPMTWWISNRLRIEREFCCDDIALSVSDSPLQYARALSNIEELRHQETTLSTASTGGSLMNRIARIFGREDGPPLGRGLWFVPLVFAVGAFAAVTIIGMGCGSESGSDAVAEAQIIGPETAEGAAVDVSNLREAILAKLQAARDRGDLTEDQFTTTVRLLDENGDCLAACADGATMICCPGDVDPGCCPEALPPECCPEGVDLDCETVDVKTIQLGGGEVACEAVVVCVPKGEIQE
jgi:Zn-dependent protease with chaperone function